MQLYMCIYIYARSYSVETIAEMSMKGVGDFQTGAAIAAPSKMTSGTYNLSRPR